MRCALVAAALFGSVFAALPAAAQDAATPEEEAEMLRDLPWLQSPEAERRDWEERLARREREMFEQALAAQQAAPPPVPCAADRLPTLGAQARRITVRNGETRDEVFYAGDFNHLELCYGNGRRALLRDDIVYGLDEEGQAVTGAFFGTRAALEAHPNLDWQNFPRPMPLEDRVAVGRAVAAIGRDTRDPALRERGERLLSGIFLPLASLAAPVPIAHELPVVASLPAPQ